MVDDTLSAITMPKRLYRSFVRMNRPRAVREKDMFRLIRRR